jgi:hypothetical protein
MVLLKSRHLRRARIIKTFTINNSMLEKEPTKHIVLIVSVVLAVTMMLLFTLQRTGALRNIVGEGKSCTMEAKLCPDGSAVGRTGPNCEFAACPSTTPVPSSTIMPSTSPVSTAGWKTYRNDTYGFEVKYPPNAVEHHSEAGIFEYGLPIVSADSNIQDKTFHFVTVGNCDRSSNVDKRTQRVINGIEFIKFESNFKATLYDKYYVDYLTKHNNECIGVSLNLLVKAGSSINYGKEFEILDQMITTFKFIN